VRQLLPRAVAEVDPLSVYGDLPTADGRAAVRLNMIASADGAAVLDGVSGGLGGPADRRVYLTLRALADVVLVGAGTVRAEGYGPPALPPELASARAELGLEGLPRVGVISRSLALDWSLPLFAAATTRPIVITAEAAPAEARARAEELADVMVAGEREVDLGRALVALGRAGVHRVLAEGGPTLNGQLAAAGLLDELCVTISPRLAGGPGGRILAGPPVPGAPALSLRSLCEQDDFLFLRLRPA
jgi:riboflavin biosynthesis pyrimidine reductase